MKPGLLILILGLCLSFGCGRPPEPKASLSYSEAQKRFEKKCRDDFDLQAVTHAIGQTLYVYLPTDKPMFDYEAQKDKAESTMESNKIKYAVQFAETTFSNGRFQLEYDIVDKKKNAHEDYGYSSSYTDSYIKNQNNLFTAISDTLFDTKTDPKEIKPQFVVIIITDIKKGIETRATFYLEDFERYMSGDLPYDEYMKRFLADTKGGQGMIGDEIGSHIDYKDITMPEFLSKQITNRINLKFARSDFPPQPDFDTDIISIVADATRYYKFNEFQEVRMNNLRSGKKFIFAKEQLASFGDDKPQDNKDESKGKLIHIIFENGQAHIQGEKSTDSITNKEK